MGKPVTGELVRMSAPDLEVIDPASREVAVSAFLEDARNSLARALEDTGPHAVAQIKAEIAVVAEMTKQLNLSKECRDDATEMVRRAEYALGKAIRKGQADGTLMTSEESILLKSAKGVQARAIKAGRQPQPVPDWVDKPKPSDFAKGNELYGEYHHGRRTGGTYEMVDNADDDQFEDALSAARSEGNLSRANVARKIKGEAKPEHKGRGNERRQLKAAESASMQLRGMLDGLAAMFDGGFEKTFTPEIAADYARKLRAEHRRLGTIINQFDSHGKGN